MRRVKVLVIGQGFMGGIAHPRAILEANLQLRPRGLEFVLDCAAGRNDAKLRTTQAKYGYLRTSTEWDRGVDAFEARFDNHCAVTFRSNRTSTGHKSFFETAIHGQRGGVSWELEDQGYLKFYSHTRTDAPIRAATAT